MRGGGGAALSPRSTGSKKRVHRFKDIRQLTMKGSVEGQMTEDNILTGICDKEGFRRLTLTEVKDYLAPIA
jgi:hypothetical protein